MRKFRIVVDGTQYEVDVEEIGGTAEQIAVPAPQVATTAEAPKSAPVQKPAGGTEVKCPMPGTVLKIVAETGSKVSKGQAIIVLEAMKMENEIAAPCDGVVTVMTTKGATVDSGSVIAVIA